MRFTLACVGVLVFSAAVATAQDWPQWMGPNNDNISKETGIAAKWAAQPKVVWKQQVGIGYSSPIAADGRVYLFSMVDRKDRLSCFDAETGKVIWEQNYSDGYNGDFPGTRATPTIQGNRIYTYGGEGTLCCRELSDGKLVWSVNIQKETNAKNLQWGTASSPLFVGDTIFVQNGRADGTPVAVGVNKNDGKIVWKSQATGRPSGGKRNWEQGGSYAQIVLADVEGTKQLIVFASDTLYGINLDDGKTIWSEQWITDWDVNSAKPVYKDGHLFITSDYGTGCAMLQLSKSGAKKLWQNKEVMSRVQPVILEDGHLYANSEGTLKCLEWPGGKVKWSARGFNPGMGGAFVRVAGHLVCMSERGELALLSATPEKCEVVSRVGVFEGQSQIWAAPLLYKGKIYAKGTNELVCLDVIAK